MSRTNGNEDLELDLRVKGQKELKVKRGEPVIFDATVTSLRNVAVQFSTLSVQRKKEELDDTFHNEQISREEYDKRTSDLKESDIEVTRLGSEENPWYSHLTFYKLIRGPSNERSKESIPWRLQILSPKPESTLVLDQNSSYASARFSSPVEELPVSGNFEIVAELDLGRDNVLESNTVQIEFLQVVADQNDEGLNTTLAQLFLDLGLMDRAETQINKFVRIKGGRAESSSAVAYLRGELEESRENFDEALSWYQKAFELFEVEFQGTDHYPAMIMLKISTLPQKMADAQKRRASS